jgi:hypothetical protein
MTMDADEAADRVELTMMRALRLTAAVDPLQQLGVLSRLAKRIDRRIQRQIQVAYETGATDSQVGRAQGLSRQAARQRRLRRTSSSVC